MIFFVRFISALILGAAATAAVADTYPSRPIQIIVPFATGGSTDAVARAVAQKMGESMRVPVIVDNKAGAAGTIGSAYVAKAAPDGYTLMLGTVSTSAVVGSLYKKLAYDPVKDFTPITEIATIPNLLVVHPSVPVHNIKELIAYAKAKPNELALASGGPGTTGSMAAGLFMNMTGVKFNEIPYRGSGPALIDTLAGQTNIMFDVVMTSNAAVKAGSLRALAVTSRQRSSVLPNVPTVAESGVPGYEAIVWFGVLGPARMPQDIVQRLNREIATALKTPSIQSLLVAQGAETVGSSPQEFAEKIKRDEAKWGQFIKDAGITAN